MVAIYKTHKLIPSKWLKAFDGDKFYLQVDKNAVTEIKFLFEPTELKPHKIFDMLPEIKVNINYSLPTNSLNTLELLCMWYVIEYFRGYEVKRD